MSSLGIRVLLLIAMAATIGCDRVTKHVAAATLSAAPARSFLADTLRLEYSENVGAFLGLGAGWPRSARIAVFGIANGLLLSALAVVVLRLRWPPLVGLGAAFVVAGGASNLLDRIVYGSVIDFLNVGLGPLRTGIFNVADVALVAAVAIMVWPGARGGAPPA